MQEDLEKAFAVIIRWEGGWTESPAEPGGASNWGISMITFGDWRKKHSLPPPTFDDLKALTSDQAIGIYEEMWTPRIIFDQLPVGVDLMVLNNCINLGVVGGINLLQQELGVPQTGKINGTTLLALRSLSSPDRAAAFCAQLSTGWLMVKRKAPNWDKYHAGWTNRANSVLASCLDMINAAIQANTAILPPLPPPQGNTQ